MPRLQFFVYGQEMGSYITADLCEVFKGYSGSRIPIKLLKTTYFDTTKQIFCKNAWFNNNM